MIPGLQTRILAASTIFAILQVMPAAGRQDGFVPARLTSAELPLPPGPQVVSGGEVLLELTVDAMGRVTEVTTLRSTPPHTDLMAAAVRGWRFTPAEEQPGDSTPLQVASRVLAAAVYRPPTLFDGPTIGQPPQDVRGASPEVPAPTRLVTPLHPPDSIADALVLVEIEVSAAGMPGETRIVRESLPGFGSAALEAAKRLEFRAAHWFGRPVRAYAYVLYGFREPIATPMAIFPGRQGPAR